MNIFDQVFRRQIKSVSGGLYIREADSYARVAFLPMNIRLAKTRRLSAANANRRRRFFICLKAEEYQAFLFA